MSIEKTRAERGPVYGDYAGGTDLRAKMMSDITKRFEAVHGRPMNGFYTIMIWDIVNKISRLAVTPDHLDSWHDISVYGQLAEEAVKLPNIPNIIYEEGKDA